MIYLRKFENHSGYETFTATTEFVLPNVSRCVQENDVHYNPWTFEAAYLTFSVKSGGVIKFSGSTAGNSLSYSLNNGEWTTANSGTNITVQSGDTIRWKGTLRPDLNNGIGKFSSTAMFDIEGNIMSLLFGDDFVGQTSLERKDAAFSMLFYGCSNVLNAKNLLLPATTLSQRCYYCMFASCTNLSTAPELPATTLGMTCYYETFNGCRSLTAAPSLPATTLITQCYQRMFKGCTGITTAPDLPATTLTTQCYNSMFSGCTSLNSITCLATDISATNCTTNWVNGVAASGTFTKAASMTSWATGDNGIPNGWTVQDA